MPAFLLFNPLLYDQGVPMIYMGDEYGHTKGGNNNTYCHDNFVILSVPDTIKYHDYSSPYLHTAHGFIPFFEGCN